MRRSTCGWTRPAGTDGRRTSWRPTARASCAASSSATARRSSSARYARAIIAGARVRADRAVRPARRDPQSPRRPRRAARPGTPPSACSRRCASRSTASSSVLERAIPAALDALAVGGRIVVLAYQSLEDRIVKRALRRSLDLHRARRAAGRAARARRAVPPAREGRRARLRGGARPQPARNAGAPARRRAREGRRMSAADAVTADRAQRTGPQERIRSAPAGRRGRRRGAAVPGSSTVSSRSPAHSRSAPPRWRCRS